MGDKREPIVMEIEYEGHEIFRRILTGLRYAPLYRRILRAWFLCFIEFITFFSILSYLGWAPLTASILSILGAAVMGAFGNIAIFQLVGWMTVMLENRAAISPGDVPRISCAITLNEDGITMNASGSSEHSSWDQISGASETDDDIYVFVESVDRYSFPKRIFHTFDELYSVKEFLRLHLGERATF